MRIPLQVWNDAVGHLSAELPREGTGILAKREHGVHYVPLRNTAFDEAHFRVHPAEWVSLLYQLEQAGESLLAIVHSHPNTPPVPSDEDAADFHYPGSYMLIVSFCDPMTPEGAMYIKKGQRLERCPFIIA